MTFLFYLFAVLAGLYAVISTKCYVQCFREENLVISSYHAVAFRRNAFAAIIATVIAVLIKTYAAS